MSRLREDSGFTLVELLISMTIMSIILGATLTVIEMMQRQTADATIRVDSRDRIRTTLDRLVKPLRNAVETSTGTIEFNGPNDLVYEAVGTTAPASATAGNNAGLQRVRICLDTTTGRIYRQTKAYTTATPPALASPPCGNTVTGDYSTADVIGTNITNDATKPMFTYDFASGSTALKDLDGIKVGLYLDANGTKPPDEVRLTTAISLRNVNQAPTASFTDAEVNGHVLVNASPSTDPEGGTLTYAWSLDGGSTVVGTDVRYDQGGVAKGVSHDFTLTVTDPSGLTNSMTRSITMP